MRVSFAWLLLLLSVLTVSRCQKPVGTQDNPYPEDHPESADAEDAEPGEREDEDEEDEKEDEEGAEEGGHGEGTDSLKTFHEDTGGDITAAHLKHLHGKFDHNNDGKVHIDEIMAFAHKSRKAIVAKEIHGIFDEIDSTKDGHLSLEEHMAETEEFHEGTDAEKEEQRAVERAKFKAADTDGDDKLDKDELVHLMHPETHPDVLEVHTKDEMKKRDLNKDGKLSKAEWEEAAPMGEHQQKETHDPAEDFKHLDANGDGAIDMDELRHWESGRHHVEHSMKQLFELADKDGDNHLSHDELTRVVDELDGHDAHAHIMDWVFHEDL